MNMHITELFPGITYLNFYIISGYDTPVTGLPAGFTIERSLVGNYRDVVSL